MPNPVIYMIINCSKKGDNAEWTYILSLKVNVYNSHEMHVMKKGHNENRNEKPHSRRVHKLVKCKSVISCLENLSKEAADEERGAVLWQEGGRGGKWRPLRSTASPSPPMPPPPPVRSNRSPTAEFSVVPPPFPPPPPPPPTDGRPLLALRDIRTPWWWLPIPLRFPYLFCLFFLCNFVTKVHPHEKQSVTDSVRRKAWKWKVKVKKWKPEWHWKRQIHMDKTSIEMTLMIHLHTIRLVKKKALS